MLRGVVHLLMYRKRMDFLYYLISKFIAKSLMLVLCLLLSNVKITHSTVCSLFTNFEWRIHRGFQGLHLTLTF